MELTMNRDLGRCRAYFQAVLLVLFSSVLLPHLLHAQSAAGAIVGNVVDASGSAVPTAAITATNQDTGVTRNTSTTADGIYNIPSLLPGTYTVEAKAQGFGPAQVKDVVVRVGSDTRGDLMLQVGQITQTVTVTEAVPLVETRSADVSQVLDQATIESIPLNARDVQQLAVIQPGVQYLTTSGYGGKSLSLAGSRPIDNRYLQGGIALS